MILFRWRCWLRTVWYAITNPPALRGPPGTSRSTWSLLEMLTRLLGSPVRRRPVLGLVPGGAR